MTAEDNRQVVARFVEVCQNQHNLAYADEIIHPEFVDHYSPEGRPPADPGSAAAAFQNFYGLLLGAFPDASMKIDEQLSERDLVATRKTFRGTHSGEIWGYRPTGKTVVWEFIDIFRVKDGKLVEHWAGIDLAALRAQLTSPPPTA